MEVAKEETLENNAVQEKAEEIVTKCSDFGHYFRELREKSGYTVMRASQATRISLPFIAALEEGDIDKLPGKIFARGFIRNLCRIYQANEDDVLTNFETCFPEQNEDEDTTAALAEEVKKKDLGKLGERRPGEGILGNLTNYFQPIPMMIAGTLMIILIATVYYATREAAPTVPDGEADIALMPQGENQTVEEDEPVPADEETFTPEAAGQNAESASTSADESATEPVSDPNLQSLSFEVKYPVTIKLALDKGEYELKELPEGQHKFTFSEEARLLIYDAAAVDLNYNGKSLGDLGKKGRVRRLSFKKSSQPAL
jgi:cytoskeletal protein RodZ